MVSRSPSKFAEDLEVDCTIMMLLKVVVHLLQSLVPNHLSTSTGMVFILLKHFTNQWQIHFLMADFVILLSTTCSCGWVETWIEALASVSVECFTFCYPNVTSISAKVLSRFIYSPKKKVLLLLC